MPKKYVPVQFAPRIYAEWGELISDLSDSDKARIFEAIIKYPNIELDSGVWRFIKSQLEKDYQIFLNKCADNQKKAKNYWGTTKDNQGITTATPGYTKDNQGEPKHKQETETKTEIKEKTIKKKNESKKAYGEFGKVLLTDAEYDKLLEKYEHIPELRQAAIDELDSYIAADKKREKRYSSHYAVMAAKNSWVREKLPSLDAFLRPRQIGG